MPGKGQLEAPPPPRPSRMRTVARRSSPGPPGRARFETMPETRRHVYETAAALQYKQYTTLLIRANSAMQAPDHWQAGSNMQLVELNLDQASAEVADVLQAYERGGMSRDTVVRIERLQSLRLWLRYAAFKEELQHSRGPAGVNERLLFHGASIDAIDAITITGFDMRLASYCSPSGNGTYFTPSSTEAAKYCYKPATAGAPGAAHEAAMTAAAAGLFGGRVQLAVPAGLPATRDRKMLLARVALGTQAPGGLGMRRPPPGCDSVYDDPHHVVFDNCQAYPEFVITFCD